MCDTKWKKTQLNNLNNSLQEIVFLNRSKYIFSIHATIINTKSETVDTLANIRNFVEYSCRVFSSIAKTVTDN